MIAAVSAHSSIGYWKPVEECAWCHGWKRNITVIAWRRKNHCEDVQIRQRICIAKHHRVFKPALPLENVAGVRVIAEQTYLNNTIKDAYVKHSEPGKGTRSDRVESRRKSIAIAVSCSCFNFHSALFPPEVLKKFDGSGRHFTFATRISPGLKLVDKPLEGWCSKGRAGSNPVPGTEVDKSKMIRFVHFYFRWNLYPVCIPAERSFNLEVRSYDHYYFSPLLRDDTLSNVFRIFRTFEADRHLIN